MDLQRWDAPGTTLKLVQDSQGVTRYAVRIKDHKRTSITRKPRYYPLPTILTNDITTWIEEIRPLAINAPLTLKALQDQLCRATVEMPADEAPDAKVCKVSKAVPRSLNQFQLIVNALHRTTGRPIGEGYLTEPTTKGANAAVKSLLVFG